MNFKQQHAPVKTIKYIESSDVELLTALIGAGSSGASALPTVRDA
jgi:hypothetical protein